LDFRSKAIWGAESSQNAPAAISESPRGTVGWADGLGIELAAKQNRPARFDTAGKSSNKTTVQYGPRFDTAREIIKRYQRMTKSHPFRQLRL
jgi:hypothetical protein